MGLAFNADEPAGLIDGRTQGDAHSQADKPA
jgi:hypothetical protein